MAGIGGFSNQNLGFKQQTLLNGKTINKGTQIGNQGPTIKPTAHYDSWSDANKAFEEGKLKIGDTFYWCGRTMTVRTLTAGSWGGGT